MSLFNGSMKFLWIKEDRCQNNSRFHPPIDDVGLQQKALQSSIAGFFKIYRYRSQKLLLVCNGMKKAEKDWKLLRQQCEGGSKKARKCSEILFWAKRQQKDFCPAGCSVLLRVFPITIKATSVSIADSKSKLHLVMTRVLLHDVPLRCLWQGYT